MKKFTQEVQFLLPMQMGGQFVEELRNHSDEEVRALATNPEAEKILDAVQYVMAEPPVGAYLHSALCAMSLPVRRPKGTAEFEPIIRRDGNYTLIIRPIERMKMVDGELIPVNLGVPFGVHARLVMLFIMTQAVKQRSREIYLGDSFSAWMRRMGIHNTNSGGPRGSRALVQEQVERLMSCEWTFRWDQDVSRLADSKGKLAKGKGAKKMSISAFSVNDMRLVNQYGGVSTADGEFVSRFVLSEAFYENLVKHSVPFNERAVAALKSSSTQIDLYTFLAMRLPKIKPGEEVRLSWKDLAAHLGNDSSTMFKFRQTVRRAWSTVSGVYQQARGSVFLDDLVVRLHYAEKPVDNQMVRMKNGSVALVSLRPSADDDGRGDEISLPRIVRFPSEGSIRWGHTELYHLARDHGSNNDIDIIANAFRKTVGEELERLEGERLLDRFERFCKAFKPAY